jgi:hypothetical protein
MSARKQINTQKKNPDRSPLISDYGELPGYNVDDYADHLTAARRKFDRLCKFSFDENEAIFESSGERIDWDLERKKKREALVRWLRDTSAVLGELLKLFYQLRDDQTVLDVVTLEQSSRRKTNSKVRGRARGRTIR